MKPFSTINRILARERREPRPGGQLHIRPEDATGTADQARPQRWSWGSLLRPLDESFRQSSPRPLSHRSVLQLRYFWLDGLFASLSENLYATFLTLFALAYGATSGQIGLLSAIGSLAAMLALFPGVRTVERTGRPRVLVVWASGVAGRLPLGMMGLLPLAVASPLAMVFSIIALNALKAFGQSYPMPAWMAMSAELVPEEARGRYFASKNIAGGVVAFAAGPLGGLLIRLGNHRLGDAFGAFPGYQLVFLLSFLVGMVATFCFWKIPDPTFHRPAEGFRLRGLLHAVTEVRMFPVFLLSGFVWNLAVQISGPFFTVCMVQKMGATAYDVGMGTGISALVALAGQYIFGRVVDRRGSVYVQILTGFIIWLFPLPWIWAKAPWHAWVMMGLGGFFWSGYNLANFNLLLQLTPQRHRARAVAAYQTVVYMSAVLGPLIGGFTVDVWGFTPMFVVTAVGRLAGTVVFAVGVASLAREARRA
jgi:MFS family permease